MARLSKRLIATVLLSISLLGISHADQPLAPPFNHMKYSPDRTCLAVAKVPENAVLMYKVDDATDMSSPHFLESALWKTNSWEREIFLAENCEFLVATYGGLNLLHLTHKVPQLKVFTVLHKDGSRQYITLGDIYENLDVLQRTTSHWNWHNGLKWDGETLTVYKVDDTKLGLQLIQAD